jgi:uncharacterized small protein (DUF1192 family)
MPISRPTLSSADEVEEQLADLNREIARLKAFVAEKDEELRVFTGRQLQDMINFFKMLN